MKPVIVHHLRIAHGHELIEFRYAIKKRHSFRLHRIPILDFVAVMGQSRLDTFA